MLFTKNTLRKIQLLALATLLVTCGGGGGNVPNPETELKEGTITGIAALGPIENGVVTAYAFSSNGRGDVLKKAESTTSAEGVYTLKLFIKSAPILVCIKQGEYTEPASTSKRIFLEALEELCSVANYKQGVDQNISISYFTQLAHGYADSLMTSNGVGVVAAIDQANTAISEWLEIDIISTLPIDITNPKSASSVLTPEHKYGFANAALSSLVKELYSSLAVPQPLFSSITSVNFTQRATEDVKNDGRLNGLSDIGVVEVGTVKLTQNEYRERLAQNVLVVAGSTQNLTTITSNNTELLNYRNNMAVYKKSIFSPISTGPTIQITSTNELAVLSGDVTVSAIISDVVEIKSVVFELVDANDTIMSPVLPVPADLANATITFNSSAYPDGQYSIKINAANINDISSSKLKSNLNINNNTAGGANIPPVAVADKLNIELSKNATPMLVLNNDYDPDSGPSPLEVRLDSTSPTAQGAIIVPNATKTGFLYTPSPTATVGTVDVISYHVFDGKDNSNVVTITVTAQTQANRNPVASNSEATAEAGTLKLITLIGSDPDVNDELSVVVDTNPTGGNGTAIAGRGKTVNFTGIRAGVTSFTYHFVDSQGAISNTATVTVTVTEKPNIKPIVYATTLSARVGQASVSKLLRASDADGPTSSLRATVSKQGTIGGFASASGLTVTYRPPAAGTFPGDSFQVTVSDGKDTSLPVTITVTLLAENTAPTVIINQPTGNKWYGANFFDTTKVFVSISATITSNGLGLKSLSEQLGFMGLNPVDSVRQPSGLPRSFNYRDDVNFGVLPDGVYSYRLVATDEGGLTGESSVQRIGIDKTPPKMTVSISPVSIAASPTPPAVLPGISATFTIAESGFSANNEFGGNQTDSGIREFRYGRINPTITNKAIMTSSTPITFGTKTLASATRYTAFMSYINSYNLTARCVPDRILLTGETLHFGEVSDSIPFADVLGTNYAAPALQCYIRSTVTGSIKYEVLPVPILNGLRTGEPTYTWDRTLSQSIFVSVFLSKGYTPTPVSRSISISSRDVAGNYISKKQCFTATLKNTADVQSPTYTTGRLIGRFSTQYKFLDAKLKAKNLVPITNTTGRGWQEGNCKKTPQQDINYKVTPNANGSAKTEPCELHSTTTSTSLLEEVEPGAASGISNSFTINYKALPMINDDINTTCPL